MMTLRHIEQLRETITGITRKAEAAKVCKDECMALADYIGNLNELRLITSFSAVVLLSGDVQSSSAVLKKALQRTVAFMENCESANTAPSFFEKVHAVVKELKEEVQGAVSLLKSALDAVIARKESGSESPARDESARATQSGVRDQGGEGLEQTQEGQTQEGQTQEGQTQEGQTQEGQTQEGQTQEGQTQEGQTQEGQTQEGQTQEGQTQEGQTQEGQTQEGQTQEGESSSSGGRVFEKWEKVLRERKAVLEGRNKERSVFHQAVIYTSAPRRRLPVTSIYLGLLERHKERSHRSHEPTEKDHLKLDVVIAFFNSLVRTDETGIDFVTPLFPEDSEDFSLLPFISEEVVPCPELLRKDFRISANSYSDEAIQCILTVDAIFLACFLLICLNECRSWMGEVEDVLSEQSERIYQDLSLQVLRSDNQIPLVLIGNVYTVLFRHSRKGSLQSRLQSRVDFRDQILGKICIKFVQANGFPSRQDPKDPKFVSGPFVDPAKRGLRQDPVMMKVRRQVTVELERCRLPLLAMYECKHLLHCQAEAVWGSANPAYLVVKPLTLAALVRTRFQFLSTRKREIWSRFTGLFCKQGLAPEDGLDGTDVKSAAGADGERARKVDDLNGELDPVLYRFMERLPLFIGKLAENVAKTTKKWGERSELDLKTFQQRLRVLVNLQGAKAELKNLELQLHMAENLTVEYCYKLWRALLIMTSERNESDLRVAVSLILKSFRNELGGEEGFRAAEEMGLAGTGESGESSPRLERRASRTRGATGATEAQAAGEAEGRSAGEEEGRSAGEAESRSSGEMEGCSAAEAEGPVAAGTEGLAGEGETHDIVHTTGSKGKFEGTQGELAEGRTVDSDIGIATSAEGEITVQNAGLEGGLIGPEQKIAETTGLKEGEALETPGLERRLVGAQNDNAEREAIARTLLGVEGSIDEAVRRQHLARWTHVVDKFTKDAVASDIDLPHMIGNVERFIKHWSARGSVRDKMLKFARRARSERSIRMMMRLMTESECELRLQSICVQSATGRDRIGRRKDRWCKHYERELQRLLDRRDLMAIDRDSSYGLENRLLEKHRRRMSQVRQNERMGAKIQKEGGKWKDAEIQEDVKEERGKEKNVPEKKPRWKENLEEEYPTLERDMLELAGELANQAERLKQEMSWHTELLEAQLKDQKLAVQSSLAAMHSMRAKKDEAWESGILSCVTEISEFVTWVDREVFKLGLRSAQIRIELQELTQAAVTLLTKEEGVEETAMIESFIEALLQEDVEWARVIELMGSDFRKLLHKIRRIHAQTPAQINGEESSASRNPWACWSSAENGSPASSRTDEENQRRTSVAISTAKELNKFGISIKGQNGIFPKFERHTVWRWRATLYLPSIQALGKDTEEKWRCLLGFEEGWPNETSVFDEFLAEIYIDEYARRHTFNTWDEETNGGYPFMTLMIEKLLRVRKVAGSRRRPFLSYLQFMDDLVNTEEDVELLFVGREPVILSNSLGSYAAVAELFNSMTQGYSLQGMQSREWAKLCTEIQEFHTSKYRRTLVEFLDTNCGKPWMVFSFLVAFLILGATIASTIYTVLGFYPH